MRVKDLGNFEAEYDTSYEDAALQSRGLFFKRFPPDSLQRLTLDEYVVGHHDPGRSGSPAVSANRHDCIVVRSSVRPETFRRIACQAPAPGSSFFSGSSKPPYNARIHPIGLPRQRQLGTAAETPCHSKGLTGIRIESGVPNAPKSNSGSNHVSSGHRVGLPTAPGRILTDLQAATRSRSSHGKTARSFRSHRCHISNYPGCTSHGSCEPSLGSSGIDAETILADDAPRNRQTRSKAAAHLPATATDWVRSDGLHTPCSGRRQMS